MAKTKVEELEDIILGQIGMLNDTSVMAKEESQELIDRSKTIEGLANSFIDIQKVKLDAEKTKIEAVKVAYSTAVGIPKEDNSVRQYLGIGQSK